MFISERERERKWERGRERGKERIQSRLHADSREPNAGLKPANHEIVT